MVENNLNINNDKTVCMLLGTNCMLKKQPHLNVKFKEQQLSQVKSFKYLGVTVDDNLKWDICTVLTAIINRGTVTWLPV